MTDEDAVRREEPPAEDPDAEDPDAEEQPADDPDAEEPQTADPDAAETPADDESAAEATLADRVADHDEALAEEVAALESDVADLEAALAERESEVETLTERLQRTQADFQNYKDRAKRQQAEIRERATEDLVERLLDVRDNLARAVEEGGDGGDGVREGVAATLRSFDDVLDAEGVERVEPEAGDEVDPHAHEVLMRVESDRPEGTVAEVYRPGYEMGGSVLRTAQVAVSEGPAEDGDE